jgi:hypothetical protein
MDSIFIAFGKLSLEEFGSLWHPNGDYKATSISPKRLAFHEQVDRLSVNETNSTLCPLL